MSWNRSNEPAAPVAPPVTSETDVRRDLRVEFRGSAREYFRIWAVNLCLTLMTLGIFSAWAKVRKKRYFYAHTTLDGTPFQYLGQPLPILRGRLIAAAFLCFYYVASHFVTSLLPVAGVIALVMAPWVLVRSMAFNARYSAFRNMTFYFDGKYRGAVRVLYLAWLPMIALMVGGVLVARTYPAVMAAAMLLAAGFFPFWIAGVKRFVVEHSGFGGINGCLSARGRQFMKIYLLAGLFTVVAGIAIGVAMFGVLRQADAPPSAAILLALPFYLAYVLAYAYVHARSTNLVWNHTRLGPLSFRSTLTGRGLAGLYLTNAIAIIGSLGLLIPWAVIRTLRYRANRLRVAAAGSLEAFRGAGGADVGAAGAEMAEFFDVDLSV